MCDGPSPGEVTQLLNELGGSRDQATRERLLALVYDELRRVAANRMRHVPASDTLQPTALVHEAYLRLVDRPDAPLANRSQFFAIAARAMRDIVVEQARRHASLKRGGDRHQATFIDVPGDDAEPADVLALEEALKALEHHDPVASEIVTLRYFAGLSVDQTANALDMGARSVDRRWRYARAWLRERLQGGDLNP